MGNGYPIAAVITTPEIASALGQALHFNTFGGNPIACSVGIATLQVIEEEGLQANAKEVGTYLLERLAPLRDQFQQVGDVRGKGLMIGIELVTDKQSKQPLGSKTLADIWESCKNMGLLLGAGGLHANVLRIKPPLMVTKEDADFTVAVLTKALTLHRNKTNSD